MPTLYFEFLKDRIYCSGTTHVTLMMGLGESAVSRLPKTSTFPASALSLVSLDCESDTLQVVKRYLEMKKERPMKT
jgi:hypothetical protein